MFEVVKSPKTLSYQSRAFQSYDRRGTELVTGIMRLKYMPSQAY